jgi:alpha-glucosidase
MLNNQAAIAIDVPASAASQWWRHAVIYQIYIRSFADANGDGIGDIDGIRQRLPYLSQLGVDAIWITPWYPSPMADGGYDVADYCAIEPTFGTLANASALIDDAHRLDIRVIVDIVPNHTSSQHPWFRAALAAGPGSPERERYLFRDGRGVSGSLPPNNWQSVFGGPAWTRIQKPDRQPGQWYLHLFAPEQPDLNWADEGVQSEFEAVLRYWLDRGVDGFRIDVAHGLVKDSALPDLRQDSGRVAVDPDGHPHWDQEGVHDIYRAWRALTDSYDSERIFVAEAMREADRLARYVRADELHTAFNFEFLMSPWDADTFRDVIERSSATLTAVGAAPTWVLSNHDGTRHLTRYGRADTSWRDPSVEFWEPVDLELGARRARAAALLMLALPGGAYIYQGEELGLWQVEDLPVDRLQDPIWRRSGHTARGRDGCRVPMPWSGSKPPFGFGMPESEPWLPQPANWQGITAEAETGDPRSMLELYRAALRLRRELAGFRSETLRWIDAPEGVLLFERGPGLLCAVNMSCTPFELPPGSEVLLASADFDTGQLAPDSAAWLWLA